MPLRSLAGLFAVLALLQACSSPEDRAREAREAAIEALARREWGAASQALEALRKARPETPDSLEEYATLMVEAGETGQAVWVLENAIARFTGSDVLHLALARAALRMGDPARARVAVESISPESDFHPEALVLRAQADLALGDLEQARVAVAAAKEAAGGESPRRLEVVLIGVATLEGEGDTGVAELRGLVEADTGDVLTWAALEGMLRSMGRAGEARDLLESALEADPDRVDLHPLLVSAHAALGDDAAAERVLRERIERHPSPGAHRSLARYRVARGDKESALARYTLALRTFPDSAMLRGARTEVLLDVGLVDDARGEFERYRKLAPMGPREEYLRARLEFAQGNAALALQRLDGVVQRLDTASTQFWLGQALEAMDDLEGAEQRYRLAVLRSPWDPVPSLNVVRLAQRRGDWRAVIRYARRAIEDGPERFAGWAALVPALIQIGDVQEAEEVARAAVERFPDRREPHVWLANSLRSQWRPAEALELLDALEAERLERYEAKARKQWPKKQQRRRRARKLEPLGPEPSELVAERALALGTGGRVEEGLELVQKALNENPDHARLHAVHAALLLAVGREREASRSTKRALNLDPSDLRPLENRARFGVARQRLDLARRDCEDYLARLPDDAPVNLLLGMAHELEARPAEAIEAYRRAAKFDERNFAARNNLAVLLQNQGELDAALVAAEGAFALAGENPSVLDTLGFVCLRKGLVDRAVPLLEKAHAAAPQVAEIQLHLAEAYRDAGRTQDARRLLGQLRARSNTPPELRAGVEEVLASLP